MSMTERILMLGLDGATWDVLDPFRSRGVMPNLDALLKRSAPGVLRSTIPPMTAAAWATMQTGCDPSRHGIFDHRYYDSNAALMRVNHAGRYRVPTLWELLDQAGRSIISLNLPGTYPAPQVRGIVVSGMDAPHYDAAVAGAPSDFVNALRHEVPRYSLQYQWKSVPSTLDQLKANAAATTEAFIGRAQGGLLADRFMPDWSALMVQFQNLDPFQHRAWRYLNVDETGIDDPPWNEAAAEVLRGLDRAIGMLVELADRRNAAILAISDHGFGPCRGRINVNRILLDAGLIQLPGTLGRLKRRAIQVADRLRLRAAKRRDPNARGASFHASIEASFPFDWKRTLAFAPHQDCGAMIYISRDRTTNLSRVDSIREEVIQALKAARHPEDNSPLFPTIVSSVEETGQDPSILGDPDIIAIPDRRYWVKTKLGNDKSVLADDPTLPGTHRPEGIVSLAAPGIDSDQTIDARLRDVAPSVLGLLGLPIPSAMQGRPFDCLKLKATRLDSGSDQVPRPQFKSFDFNSEDEKLVEQRLIDLGYLG